MKSNRPFSVLVTRPAHQSGNLTRLIENRGWRAVLLPTIEIAPLSNSAEWLEKPEKLKAIDTLIFISANAVNFALKANNGKISQFEHCKIAAVGRATASALASYGVAVDWMPETGFDSEAILSLPGFHNVEGRRFVIVRGQGGREKLADTLRERGAQVDYWEVYRRELPQIDVGPVVGLLKCGGLDVITATSGEALQNLVTLLGVDVRGTLLCVPLFVISERMKQIAEEIGFSRIALASGPSDEAIVEKISNLLNGE